MASIFRGGLLQGKTAFLTGGGSGIGQRMAEPLGKLVAQVLTADRQMIKQGYFYAWDPLAGVALLYPRIVKTSSLRIEIRQDPPEEGRTMQTAGRPNADVAMDVDAPTFRKLFLEAFEK